MQQALGSQLEIENEAQPTVSPFYLIALSALAGSSGFISGKPSLLISWSQGDRNISHRIPRVVNPDEQKQERREADYENASMRVSPQQESGKKCQGI